MSDPISREETRAALEAYRELSPTHGDEVIDAFVARVERRLEERLAKQPHRSQTGGGVVLGIASLALAIPLIAIPAAVIGGFGGALAILAVVALLITLNALYWEKAK